MTAEAQSTLKRQPPTWFWIGLLLLLGATTGVLAAALRYQTLSDQVGYFAYRDTWTGTFCYSVRADLVRCVSGR